MTPEQMQQQLNDISAENKKLKAARKYRTDAMAGFIQQIEQFRKDIQQIDSIISVNTERYMQTAEQLRSIQSPKTIKP